MQNDFTKAMDFRHACKLFDEDKKIDQETLHYILEAGINSPSSFGMEPWKFLVISNEALKTTLKPLCWNQAQITSCSHLVVIIARIDSVKVQSGEVEKRFKRRQMPQENLDFYLDLYAKHLQKTLSTNDEIYAWTSKQCYIALANMMTAAAFVGVDSCPIEGFEKEKVESVLELDTNHYQVAVLLPLGYRINEQSKQLRLPFEDVVSYIR